MPILESGTSRDAAFLPGDHVFLGAANSAEWVACFWGILLRGAVVVPMTQPRPQISFNAPLRTPG